MEKIIEEYCEGKVKITINHYYYLENIVVVEEHRGKGLARKALEEFKEETCAMMAAGEEEIYYASVTSFLVPAFEETGWTICEETQVMLPSGFGIELRDGAYYHEERAREEILVPMRLILSAK